MVHPGRRWCSPVKRMAARVEVTARFTRVHTTWGMVSGNLSSPVEGERVTGEGLTGSGHHGAQGDHQD